MQKPAAQHGDPVACARAVANETVNGSMRLLSLGVEVVESVTRFDSTRNIALCSEKQVDVFFNASEFELTSTCFMPQLVRVKVAGTPVTTFSPANNESNSSILSPLTEQMVRLACPCAIHEAEGSIPENVTVVAMDVNATNSTLNNSTRSVEIREKAEPERFAGLVLSIEDRTIHTGIAGKICAAPLQPVPPNSTFNASMLAASQLESQDVCWGA